MSRGLRYVVNQVVLSFVNSTSTVSSLPFWGLHTVISMSLLFHDLLVRQRLEWVLSVAPPGAQSLPVRFSPLDKEVVSMMGQSVQSGVRHHRVRKQRQPVLWWTIAGDDEGSFKVTFRDQFVDVLRLGGGK